jgi:hypothetical protein
MDYFERMHRLEPQELISEYCKENPTGRQKPTPKRPIVDFGQYDFIDKVVVADGTTCLCCESKLPKHMAKCVLSTTTKK